RPLHVHTCHHFLLSFPTRRSSDLLYDMIINQHYDLVSGWKKKRYDSVLSKNIPSKLFNWAARKTSGLKLHDFNCGLKAYHQKVVDRKSTRLNSSHVKISYAVFCLK